MRRCLSVLLFASVAGAGLGGCRAQPSEAPTNAAVASAQPGRAGAAPIDFAADPSLRNACQALAELPFERFESRDFVYGSRLPVRVSGTYYEVRGTDAADAATVYDEIRATIFRDVQMVVEADRTAPDFSFDRWAVPFAVSDHPFSASRQLRYRRAMGATFPFLDLAGIPAATGRPDSGGSTFSRNFISALNFLASRGENVWGRTNRPEERERARALRRATTATDYERTPPIADDDLAALRSIPPGERPSLHNLGNYIVISLGRPARFVAAIDTTKDAIGLRACDGDL